MKKDTKEMIKIELKIVKLLFTTVNIKLTKIEFKPIFLNITI